MVQASGPLPAIQTAEELGRKAWVPNAALNTDEKACQIFLRLMGFQFKFQLYN